ncbi:uncharacterized protein F5891DRAFT_1013906 [Suillus fuscotomentosus]|uniref:Uncharacterized protein n=1 Tax=Suillus fuscotomentosus TaxID=1912939 RepID=A0AAD4HPK7_9AGAM|nr:uncharacterized protein F5891DRAFT_1013906 [Suillus fuscotomentosus]KAG1904288.1 hypothetical protein F5891DRAFT_1013906 [Suillus fuscotomentosus]
MSRMRTSDKEAEPEIDHLPPAYDTLSIHGGVPSIPAIAIALAHHDEATPIGSISTVVTDVQEFEPPSRSLAHTLPRSRSNIDFATQVTKLPNDVVIPTVDVNKSFPELPQFNSLCVLLHQKRTKHTQARKAKSGSSSWLSFLPFISSKATKRDRQSVLALIHDLVVPPPSNSGNLSPKSPQSALADPHEILASCSKICSTKNLSLSTLLQEPHIAGHTAIYWAIVNYNPSLLDALLKYASPLTPTTLSETRKACLVVSNQPLFQNLRHSVGLCASGLRSATDGLLLGQRPPDDVRIEEGPNGTFAATLDIAMWQKRIRAVGSVSVEFIASGHIFALTFFTADRPQPKSKSTKDKRAVGPLHVSLSLLEHSLPTYVDAAVVIDGPPPLPPWPCLRPPRNSSPRKHIHSASFSGKETGYGFENGVGLWGCEANSNYDEQARTRLPSPSSLSSPGYSRPATFSGANAQEKMLLPPPSHSHRGLIQTHSSPSLKQLSSSPSRSSHMLTSVLDSKVTALTPKKQLLKLKNASLGSSGHTPVVLRFSVGKSLLAYRMKNGADPHGLPHPTTIKPDTWSEHGTRYVSAIVMPLGEQDGAGLMFDTSPHIASDGSLRARLEARLVKTEEGGKECIIC